jgi:hypothetical protein
MIFGQDKKGLSYGCGCEGPVLNILKLTSISNPRWNL